MCDEDTMCTYWRAACVNVMLSIRTPVHNTHVNINTVSVTGVWPQYLYAALNRTLENESKHLSSTVNQIVEKKTEKTAATVDNNERVVIITAEEFSVLVVNLLKSEADTYHHLQSLRERHTQSVHK